jgi:hypothetical protein
MSDALTSMAAMVLFIVGMSPRKADRAADPAGEIEGCWGVT